MTDDWQAGSQTRPRYQPQLLVCDGPRILKQSRQDGTKVDAADVCHVRHPARLHCGHGTDVKKLNEKPYSDAREFLATHGRMFRAA